MNDSPERDVGAFAVDEEVSTHDGRGAGEVDMGIFRPLCRVYSRGEEESPYEAERDFAPIVEFYHFADE